MKLLLMLNATHLHLQLRAGRKVLEEQLYTLETRAQFAEFVRQHVAPCYVLTDWVEEDFHLETIPPVQGNERAALLQRKFAQRYHGTDFYLANELQRHSDGRHDVDMLLSALTNPALIQPWLDSLHAAHIPLVGIYSVAQLSASLLSETKAIWWKRANKFSATGSMAEELLLVSYQTGAGLRQSYFKFGKLQFSRLSPLPADTTLHDHFAKELPRTRQYLRRLNHLATAQKITVRVWCDDRLVWRDKFHDNDEIRYEFITLSTPSQFADHGSTSAPRMENLCAELGDASPLFLQQLADHPPQNQYAQATHLHDFKLWKIRRVLQTGAAVLFSACALWAASNAWEGWQHEAARAEISAQTRLVQSQTQQIVNAMPQADAPPADVKAVVLLFQKLKQNSVLPETVLPPLSRVMDQFLEVELDELAWQVEPAATHGTLLLQAHLTQFAGDYRAALQRFAQFQTALQQAGYQVTVQSAPVKISQSDPVADTRSGDAPPFDFTLKLRWKLLP